MTTSVLDGVPGLGPSRRAALLERFGTVSALRAADVAALCEVPGIGASTAAAIRTALGADARPDDVTDSDGAEETGPEDDAR